MNRHLSLLPLLFAFAACGTTTQTTTSAAPNGETMSSSSYDRPGFTVMDQDGRLLVFCNEDPELANFKKHGDLVKSVTRIGAGPGGRTVRAPDAETIEAYTLARPGFVTRIADGRIWVFAAGSKDWDEFLANGEPAKSVTKIGAGPNGATVKSSDTEVITKWLAAL